MTIWNPAEYVHCSAPQTSWAQDLLSHLELKGTEAVLDLGCGDGKITAALAQAVPRGRAVGIDSSQEMIRYAQTHHPAADHANLVFRVLNVGELDFRQEFDLVFSNATLHWVEDHRPILGGAYRALRKGGRLALSFGGKGNAFDILKIMFGSDLSDYLQGFKNPYYFYGPEEYRPWLDQAGFITQRVELMPKDTIHPGLEGVVSWIRATWMPITSKVPEAKREDFIRDLATAYVTSFPPDAEGNVHVRMVRLEVEATRPPT
jgi:trans-aconitate methyltransferase